MARLASALREDEDVMIEYMAMPSIVPSEAKSVGVTEGDPGWMDVIRAFLEEGRLLDDRVEARRLKLRASRYMLLDEILYKRSLTLPYLRCLSPTKLELVMTKIHKGVCGNHLGADQWSISSRLVTTGQPCILTQHASPKNVTDARGSQINLISPQKSSHQFLARSHSHNGE